MTFRRLFSPKVGGGEDERTCYKGKTLGEPGAVLSMSRECEPFMCRALVPKARKELSLCSVFSLCRVMTELETESLFLGLEINAIIKTWPVPYSWARMGHQQCGEETRSGTTLGHRRGVKCLTSRKGEEGHF